MPRSLLFAASTFAVACAAPAANAWDFTATPYLWFAGIDAHVAVSPGLPPVHVEQSFSDVVNDAQLAFAAKVEARQGIVGLIGEINYVDTGASSPLFPPFTTAQLDTKTVLLAGAAAVRLFDSNYASIDALGGVRATWAENDLTVGTIIGGVRDGEADEVWGDGYIGARGALSLTDHWSLGAYADVGAGYSDYTWQAYGVINYALGSIELSGGYRVYADNYDDDGYLYDIVESGVILGATFSY